MNKLKSVSTILITILLVFGVGSLLILAIGENPIAAYKALIRGAFGTKLGLGNTLSLFTPLILSSIAFAVAAKGGAFNVGVEGEICLGGIAAAFVGVQFAELPGYILIPMCFIAAMAVAGAYALIPALLKVYLNVSEVCVTILMNSVAFYFASYLVSGPLSAGTANPQTHPVGATLPKIMLPSALNVGIFIALGTTLFIIFMVTKTKWGYKLRTVGINPLSADYLGIDSKKMFINAMVLSGMIGGLAGAIEVLGAYGYYLDNFAYELGTNGMLAALIAKSNMILTPLMAFFLASLKSGSLLMQQATGIPKSIVDTISAIFIITATMELLFTVKERQIKATGKTGLQKVAESLSDKHKLSENRSNEHNSTDSTSNTNLRANDSINSTDASKQEEVL